MTRLFGRREGGREGGWEGGGEGVEEMVVGVVLLALCVVGVREGLKAPYRCRGILEAAAWLLLGWEGREGWRRWGRKRKSA